LFPNNLQDDVVEAFLAKHFFPQSPYAVNEALKMQGFGQRRYLFHTGFGFVALQQLIFAFDNIPCQESVHMGCHLQSRSAANGHPLHVAVVPQSFHNIRDPLQIAKFVSSFCRILTHAPYLFRVYP